ncbi:MAG: hypothetical protein ACREUF_18660, partial [Solimonas sp.]
MKKLLLLALFVPAAACASAGAQTQPVEHPPMAVPPVPPRIIEAPAAVEPQPLEPVAEMPTAPVNPPRSRPPQRDPAKNNSTDPKVEAKPPDVPADPATPPAATLPVPPLRPQGSAEGPEMARRIRETLDRATKMLDTIDIRTLSTERKVNYDAARDFIKQAEEAITQDKLVFAKNLADRAE